MQATNDRAMPLRSRPSRRMATAAPAPRLSEFEPDPIRALEKARLEATRR
jgi:hypothetical protein